MIAAFLLLLGQSAAGQVPPPAVAPPSAPQPEVKDSPADTAEIVAAVNTCVNGVPPADFLPADFAADGWLPGGRKQTTIQGLPVEQLLYGRPDGHVVNIVQIVRNLSTSCLTVARLHSKAQETEIHAEIAAKFGALPFDKFQGDEPFKAAMLKASPNAGSKFMLTAHNRFLISVNDDGKAITVTISTSPKRGA